MKKILSAFTAALMLALCGCDSNNTDSELPPVDSIPVGTSEEPADQEMRIYTDADFTDIAVNVNNAGGAMPVEVKEYDVSDMIFEEKLSPCKKDGVREEMYKRMAEAYEEAHYYSEEYIQQELEMYSGPEHGRVIAAALGMGVIYVAVSYDNYCPIYCHSYEIWTYRLSDGGMQLKYVYESADRAASVSDMRYVGETLYLEVYSCDTADVTRENEEHSLMRLNEETEVLETVYDDEFVLMLHDSGDRLMIRRLNGNEYYSDSEKTVLEYDPETQKWTERYSCNGGGHPLCNGSNFIHYEIREEGYYTYYDIVGESFRINTETKGAPAAYIGNCVVCSVNTANSGTSDSDTLYVYDLDTMERYIMDIGSYNVFCRVGDGLILRNSVGDEFYCLIPQLGVLDKLISVKPAELEGVSMNPYIDTIISGDNILVFTHPPLIETNEWGTSTTRSYQCDKLYIISAI